MTKKYLDIKLFENFSIDYGDIISNDYQMCFPIWDLHEGTIRAVKQEVRYQIDHWYSSIFYLSH